MNNDLQVAHPHSGSSSTWYMYLVELEFRNVGFWREAKTGVPGEKPLGVRERTNNKLNPYMASTPGVKPGPHWWEASALTTAPSLASITEVSAGPFQPSRGGKKRYNLRKSDFIIPRFNTIKYGKHFLLYLGPFLWSKLTKKERDMNCLNGFKTLLGRYVDSLFKTR